jgi:hypothetical protein
MSLQLVLQGIVPLSIKIHYVTLSDTAVALQLSLGKVYS